MTAYEHAQAVLRRAIKRREGVREARAALRNVVHEEMRRQRAETGEVYEREFA